MFERLRLVSRWIIRVVLLFGLGLLGSFCFASIVHYGTVVFKVRGWLVVYDLMTQRLTVDL